MVIESALESVSYDDVFLLPVSTSINSRDEVNLKNQDGIYPIFSSPMRNISEPELIVKLVELGGIGILHRFFKDDADKYAALEYLHHHLSKRGMYNFGVSIGINSFAEELEFVKFAAQLGVAYICVDTANGYMDKTLSVVEKLNSFLAQRDLFIKIIAGNVVTGKGVRLLSNVGCDYIRVGIGSGSVCSTSNMTGIGCPTLTAIRDCADEAVFIGNVKIIADGGIKSSGEAVKALAFGADAVMLGGLFGKAREAHNNGEIYGMSSAKLQSEMGKKIKSNEGLEKRISEDEIKPLEEIFEDFVYGIKSGFSYLNCDSLACLHESRIEYIRTGKGSLKNL